MAAEPEVLNLLVTAGLALGAEIRVEDELVIGRHEEGPGKLAGDIEISRRHARISRGADGFSIEDLGSTNGTVVNGQTIDAPRALAAGDTVEVGGTTMLVEAPHRGATPTATAVPVEAQMAEAAEAAVAEPAAEPAVAEPAVEPATAEPAVEPATAESAPVAAPEPAVPPRLGLRLDVDLAAGEAEVRLDGEAEPVRLVHEDGRWRIAPD